MKKVMIIFILMGFTLACNAPGFVEFLSAAGGFTQVTSVPTLPGSSGQVEVTQVSTEVVETQPVEPTQLQELPTTASTYQLVGTWDCVDTDGATGVFKFNADGTATLNSFGENMTGTYTANFSTTPATVDIHMNELTSLCILEFSDADHMRIDGSSSGSRPTTFGNTTMTCTRK